MTRVQQIFVDGKCVTITARHVEIAKLIYSRRPHHWPKASASSPWDEVPAMIQIEWLELANAVLTHPAFAGGRTCEPVDQG